MFSQANSFQGDALGGDLSGIAGFGLCDAFTGLAFGQGELWLLPGIAAIGGLWNESSEFAAPLWVLSSGGVSAVLDIDFVNNQAWSTPRATIPSLLTCTRASTGYYTNANGTLTSFGNNVLRYGSNGLLVEGSRTNSVTQSNTFTNTAWTASGSHLTPTSGQSDPAGGTTAFQITDDATNNAHYLFNNSFTTTNVAWTLSLHVQGGTGSWIQLSSFDGTTQFWANFNVTTGVAGASSAGTTNTITALASGWYRITMSMTPAANAGTSFAIVTLNGNIASNAPAYLGTGSTWNIFGAQAEAGAFATSYIPTTSSSATRAADLDTLTSITGVAAQGTWVFYYNLNTAASTKDVLSYGSVSAGKLLEFFVSSTPIAVFNWFSTGTGGIGSNLSVNTLEKGAFNFDSVGNIAAVSNASSAATASSSDYTGAATAIAFGARSDASQSLNGYIRRAAFWNVKLSTAAMQTLTT